MRSESVRPVRIRSGEVREETGSVSPPAIGFSGDGKLVFADKMRKIYGEGLDPEQLEVKIEQLWKGLTPSQREKFIGKSGEKENLTETPPKTSRKPCIPVLERRNNCKAIARVLDLKTRKPSVVYADLVKNRMKAYKKEGTIIVGRQLPLSPPTDRNRVKEIESVELPIVFNTLTPEETPERPQKPQKPVKIPEIPRNLPRKEVKTKITRIPAQNTITKRFVVRKNVVPSVPMISYNDACQKYYYALSQSFLVGPGDIDYEMLPMYANIMEGCRPIREYNFGVNL